MVPNTTILNSIPCIDKRILQLNKFLLEPLNLLGNPELVTEFIELRSELRDNRLRSGHVTQVEALEIVRQSGFTGDQLSLKLVANSLTKLVKLILGLVDSAVDRVHSCGELLADNRVL